MFGGRSGAPPAMLAVAAVPPPCRTTAPGHSPPPAPLRAAGGVSISFQLPYRCKFGQKLCLIGSNEVLGGWRVEQAVPMNWSEVRREHLRQRCAVHAWQACQQQSTQVLGCSCLWCWAWLQHWQAA